MSNISSVAIYLSKKDGKTNEEKKHERELTAIKKRQKDVERRVGALERQVAVIRRQQG